MMITKTRQKKNKECEGLIFLITISENFLLSFKSRDWLCSLSRWDMGLPIGLGCLSVIGGLTNRYVLCCGNFGLVWVEQTFDKCCVLLLFGTFLGGFGLNNQVQPFPFFFQIFMEWHKSINFASKQYNWGSVPYVYNMAFYLNICNSVLEKQESNKLCISLNQTSSIILVISSKALLNKK